MSGDILLSICIPTYNRATFLKEAISSVLLQLSCNTELVISDNSSDDNTKDVVKKFLDENNEKNITYFRNNTNLGFDGNILNLINLAKGRYILFLGDDDILVDGSLAYVSKILTSNIAVAMVFLNYQTLSHYGNKVLHFPEIQKDMYFEDKNKFLSFLGYYITFISSTLINKALACEAINKHSLLRFNGRAQIHYYISLAVASIKPRNFNLIFTSRLCVLQGVDTNPPWNGFNEFGTRVIEVFKSIEKFGYDHKVTKKIINMILINFVFKGAVVVIGQDKIKKDQINGFFKNVYKENKSNIFFWVFVFPVFCIPKSVIRLIYRLYKKCREHVYLISK